MQTLWVISAGFALLALLCALGWQRRRWRGVRRGARFFIALWLIGSLVNLSVGVVSAGNTLAQGGVVMLMVFGIPFVIAVIVARWARHNTL